jgi:hypothetical protein
MNRSVRAPVGPDSFDHNSENREVDGPLTEGPDYVATHHKLCAKTRDRRDAMGTDTPA